MNNLYPKRIKINKKEGMVLKEILQSSSISIIKGIIISCIVTLVLLFIYSVLLTYTKIEENTINIAVILITTVSILARKFHTAQEK